MSELYRVHPKLIPYISALATHKFGLLQEPPQIQSVESGGLIMENDDELGDRFVVKISYCTKTVDWQILMCPDNLTKPPDFVMEEDYLIRTNVELIKSEVPSLANWQPENPKSLLNVVLELMRFYKLVQASWYSICLEEEKRLFFECSALMRFTDLGVDDFEFNFSGKSKFSFLARLNIDYSKLPATKSLGKRQTLILLEIKPRSKNSIILINSANLDSVYGKTNFPPYLKQHTFHQYFSIIRKQLQTKIDQIAWRLQQRKILCTYFTEVLRGAILDIDNVWFQKVSLLLEHCEIFYVIKVVIPKKYPDHPPRVSLTPMMNPKNELPIFIPLDKFKYSPKFDHDKMFETIYDFIILAAMPLT